MAAAISVDKTLTQARQAVKKQDWLAAQSLCQRVLDKFPKNKRAQQTFADLRSKATPSLLEAAQEAERSQDWHAARANLEAAAALAPDIPQIQYALGACLVELSDFDAALGIADRLIARNSNDIESLNLKGRALHEIGDAEASKAVSEQVLKQAPDNAIAQRNLGLVARSQGDKTKAAQHFQESLRSRPKDGAIHVNMAAVHTYKPNDPHITQMRQAIASIGKDNPDSAPIHFGMFEALHSLKEHEEAFAYLAHGNKLSAQKHPYNLRADLELAGFAKATFPNPITRPDTQAAPPFVFITGLPRSGTTLAERILSRAPDTQACGEQVFVREAVIERLMDIQTRKQQIWTQKDFEILRAQLLENYASISDGSAIQIDKMPLNYAWMGFIATALPEARIIHMNRDLRAVAWSLYRNTFRKGMHDFIYDFDSIAKYMVLHRELMTHWRSICADYLFDLNYADLVTDQANATRALAKGAGIDWHDDLMSPEKAKTHVRTSSAGQVTQPIYSGSDAAWKTYETQLAPLMKSLKQVELI